MKEKQHLRASPDTTAVDSLRFLVGTGGNHTACLLRVLRVREDGAGQLAGLVTVITMVVAGKTLALESELWVPVLALLPDS